MFMRFVQLSIRPDATEAFERFYSYRVAPALLDVDGCVFARLIRNENNPTNFLSFTLWNTAEHANAFESSGYYDELIAENEPFTESSSEWKIQLTEDNTLEYREVEEKPIIKAMPIVAGTEDLAPTRTLTPDTYVRILSARVEPDSFDEFRSRYDSLIVPELLQIDGCRAAYLIGRKEQGEGISVTVWDSKRHADLYEKSGKFQQLFSIIQPLLSSLYQWKMSLDPSRQSNTSTSDDVSVEGYRIVTGESL